MIDRYFTTANFLLITAGIYLCVNTFYALVTSRLDFRVQAPVSVSQSAPEPVKHTKRPIAEYKAIAGRNLFNVRAEEVDAPEPKTEKVDIDSLKETELKLRLWGTVTGQDKRSYAVIEDTKAREQNLYREGESIQNAVVKLILREKVVLRVGDNDEILAMEEIRGSRGGRSQRSRTGHSGSPSSPRKLPVSSYPRKIRLKAEQIQKEMENLGQLMEQANLRPNIVDGQPAGISITGIKPNAIFRKMRLRNGDVITGVNGGAIESVEEAVKVVEQLSSGSDIQLQIKRRGREQTREYSIE